MLNVALPSLRTILCVGAHSDDIEIGCGGTILRLARDNPGCEVHWVVFGARGIRQNEAQQAASKFVRPEQLKRLMLHDFRDGFMPFVGTEIKDVFERLKGEFSPDLIFTHQQKDAHQDHRLLAELTWNTYRDHLILEYEIPKYDGDMGQPSVYVPLTQGLCQRKIDFLMEVFRSQQDKRWFTRDTFLSLMRLRGMECNAPEAHAEAFYCRKMTL